MRLLVPGDILYSEYAIPRLKSRDEVSTSIGSGRSINLEKGISVPLML